MEKMYSAKAAEREISKEIFKHNIPKVVFLNQTPFMSKEALNSVNKVLNVILNISNSDKKEGN